MYFENKAVLVTGAGTGIGEAIAVAFAKEGANVVIVDKNKGTSKETAEKCKAYGKKVLVIQTDITKIDEAKESIEKTINEFKKLDVLVNNAGIIRTGNLLSGTLMNTFDDIMNLNLRATVVMSELAVPYLIKSKGCIVNTSSVANSSTNMRAQFPAYCMSKVALDCFTRLSAHELASKGIRVNAVSPGPTNTKVMFESGVDSNIDIYKKWTALERIVEPQEVADLILYLASDKAKSITGSIYAIDNGMSLI